MPRSAQYAPSGCQGSIFYSLSKICSDLKPPFVFACPCYSADQTRTQHITYKDRQPTIFDLQGNLRGVCYKMSPFWVFTHRCVNLLLRGSLLPRNRYAIHQELYANIDDLVLATTKGLKLQRHPWNRHVLQSWVWGGPESHLQSDTKNGGLSAFFCAVSLCGDWEDGDGIIQKWPYLWTKHDQSSLPAVTAAESLGIFLHLRGHQPCLFRSLLDEKHRQPESASEKLDTGDL